MVGEAHRDSSLPSRALEKGRDGLKNAAKVVATVAGFMLLASLDTLSLPDGDMDVFDDPLASSDL